MGNWQGASSLEVSSPLSPPALQRTVGLIRRGRGGEDGRGGRSLGGGAGFQHQAFHFFFLPLTDKSLADQNNHSELRLTCRRMDLCLKPPLPPLLLDSTLKRPATLHSLHVTVRLSVAFVLQVSRKKNSLAESETEATSLVRVSARRGKVTVAVREAVARRQTGSRRFLVVANEGAVPSSSLPRSLHPAAPDRSESPTSGGRVN